MTRIIHPANKTKNKTAKAEAKCGEKEKRFKCSAVEYRRRFVHEQSARWAAAQSGTKPKHTPVKEEREERHPRREGGCEQGPTNKKAIAVVLMRVVGLASCRGREQPSGLVAAAAELCSLAPIARGRGLGAARPCLVVVVVVVVVVVLMT